MNFNPATVWTLFRAEMRMVLRDRRILLTSILLPVVVMPLLFAGSRWSLKRREATLTQGVFRYALAGQKADAARAVLETTRQRLGSAAFRFEEVSPASPTTALAQAEIELIVEGLVASPISRAQPLDDEDDHDISLDHLSPTSHSSHEPAYETNNPLNPLLDLRITYRGDRDVSSAAFSQLSEALRDTRRAQRAALLTSHGFPIGPSQVATVTEINLATPAQLAGLTFGRLITLLLLACMLMGGAIVATDSLAGEKERGTLETLLTTSARRIEIIAAKNLVILCIASLITFIQSANLLVYAGFRLIPVPPHLAAAVSPGVALLLFLLYLPVAASVAGVLLLVSGRAKSYKEAQMYFFPVFLLGLVPGVAPFLPGLSLHSVVILVPVANIALAARDILTGLFDWPMILGAWLVTAGAAAGLAQAAVRSLSNERLITATETDAEDLARGPALFGRHVLNWFAVLWAVLLIANNYLEKAGLRSQLFVNLVAIFFTASWLMLRRYRLNARAALALRAPKPAVWLGVLLAVPSGLLTASGLFRLARFLFPISKSLIEQFDQSVIPPDMSWFELVFFLAIMPGIFEEITFRGLLLYGLSQRLRPIGLALAVGLIFGLFHFALFRFAPTAFLGILLAAVTLLTGSIFPAMLWHTLSNATALFAHLLKIPLEELDAPSYLLGAAIMTVAFWIIWRNRTPYPGLRPWRPGPAS